MTQVIAAYVDSADEQLAFLLSQFGPQEQWQVVEQRMSTLDNGDVVERATVRTSEAMVNVEFRDAHPVHAFEEPGQEDERIGKLDRILEAASRFAATNPPHHPGSIPRFPVPVEHYPGAVAVPLPILAVDDQGARGLFAPPRMAVVSWQDAEPVGVREFDGFDPANWPPPRLGDWPAPAVTALDPEVLQACIQRFGACWSRLIDAWFQAEGKTPQRENVLVSDANDALRLRRVLDLPAMDEIYRLMNPRFDLWIRNLR